MLTNKGCAELFSDLQKIPQKVREFYMDIGYNEFKQDGARPLIEYLRAMPPQIQKFKIDLSGNMLDEGTIEQEYYGLEKKLPHGLLKLKIRLNFVILDLDPELSKKNYSLSAKR